MVRSPDIESVLLVPETTKVPLLVTFPETVSELLPARVKIAPPEIVKLLQSAALPVLMMGWFPPEGIITSVEEPGNNPPHQFERVFQSELVFPDQVPIIQPVEVFTSPVEPAKNHLLL